MSLGKEGAGATSCPLRTRWGIEVEVDHHSASDWPCGAGVRSRCRKCIGDLDRHPRDVLQILSETKFGGH